MKAILALVAILPLAGCQLILGLDETSVGDLPDAPITIDARIDAPPEIDAPPACAGPIACPFTTGRSLCGQIYGSGDQAGPLRGANPTGELCTTSARTDGPCALAISAGTVAQFDGTDFGLVAVPATVDDCGRFAILDLTLGKDAMVVVTGPDYVQTNNLYSPRGPDVGADEDAHVVTVSSATTSAWAEQLVPGIGKSITSGILYTFLRSGSPKAGVRAAIDQLSPPATVFFNTDPVDPSWAAYFDGATPFGVMDPTNVDDATVDPPVFGSSEASGTAYSSYGTVDMHADGLQVGLRCKVPLHLTHPPNGFLVVTIDGC